MRVLGGVIYSRVQVSLPKVLDRVLGYPCQYFTLESDVGQGLIPPDRADPLAGSRMATQRHARSMPQARVDGEIALEAAVRSKLARPRRTVPPPRRELSAWRAYISSVPADTHLSKDM